MSEPLEVYVLRAVEDDIPNASEAVLGGLKALLISGNDDPAIFPETAAHAPQRDGVKRDYQDGGQCRTCRVEVEQHEQDQGADQQRADRLDEVEDKAEDEMLDLVQRRNQFAGMARDVEQIGLVKQPALDLDRQLMPQPIGETLALPCKEQAQDRRHHRGRDKQHGRGQQRASRGGDGRLLQPIQPFDAIGAR